jgi:hypothetical protein
MSTIVKFLRPLGLAAATVAAGSFILQSAPAQAVDLVTNGTFSAPLNPNGTVPGWTQSGVTSITNASSFITPSTSFQIQGLLSALGNVGSVRGTNLTGINTGTWSQTLSTVPNTTYKLSYAFGNSSNVNNIPSIADQSFQVQINDQTPQSLAFLNLSGTKLNTNLYTGEFIGSGTDKLSFIFNNVAASAIDNVIVDGLKPTGTPAPEPFTIIGTLIGGSAAIRMRKKLNLSK